MSDIFCQESISESYGKVIFIEIELRGVFSHKLCLGFGFYDGGMDMVIQISVDGYCTQGEYTGESITGPQ